MGFDVFTAAWLYFVFLLFSLALRLVTGWLVNQDASPTLRLFGQVGSGLIL